MSRELQPRLREFTRAVLERRGALVEWPENADEGWAMLPPELAAALQSGELLRVSHRPESGGLCANLATDFLDRITPLVDAEPRVGLFQIPEMYLKKSAMEEPVARAFTWHNAKVKVKGTAGMRVEYHAWSFLAALHSEDSWEDLISFTLNSFSGAEVAMSDPLGLDSVQSFAPPAAAAPDTHRQAVRRATAHVERNAGQFVARLEFRLGRDRRRLHDYYNALLKEAGSSRVRDAADREDQAAKKRAVELELRRKLAELEERYAVRVLLTPLVLVRLELPVLSIQCEVFRKQAHKDHILFWNPVMTALEPMACSRCRASSFSIAFTDNDVQPLCASCAK